MEERHLLSRFKDLLVDFPALVRLVYRLLKDPRVSKADKLILAGIVVYVINPTDLLPDAIPVIGQIDDAYLLALGLLRLLNRTEKEVLLEHWEGQHDILALLNEIVELAVCYLPEGVQKVLVGKVGRFDTARK